MEKTNIDIRDVDDILDSGIISEEDSGKLNILYNQIGRMCIEYGHLMSALSTNSRVHLETPEETKRQTDKLLIQINALQKEIDELNSKIDKVIDISKHRRFKGARQSGFSDDIPNIVA